MKEKLWTTTFVVNMLLNFIFYLVFYLPTVVIGTMAVSYTHLDVYKRQRSLFVL